STIITYAFAYFLITRDIRTAREGHFTYSIVYQQERECFFMGCQNDCDRRGVRSTGQCVTDEVRRILEAQRKAADASEYGGSMSCDRCMDDLLAPSRRGPSRRTSILFMLSCNDACSTFFGPGFTNSDHHRRHQHDCHCIVAPVFNV